MEMTRGPVVLTDVAAHHGDYLAMRWREGSAGRVVLQAGAAALGVLFAAVVTADGAVSGRFTDVVTGLFLLSLVCCAVGWVPRRVLDEAARPATVVIDASGLRTERVGRRDVLGWACATRLDVGRRLLVVRTRSGGQILPLRFITADGLALIVAWARQAGVPVREHQAGSRVLRAAGEPRPPVPSVVATPDDPAGEAGGDGDVQVTWRMPAPGQYLATLHATWRANWVVVVASALWAASTGDPVAMALVAAGVVALAVWLAGATHKHRADVGLDVRAAGVTTRAATHLTHYAWTEMTGVHPGRRLVVFDHPGPCPLVVPRGVFTDAQVARIADIARAAGVPVRGR